MFWQNRSIRPKILQKMDVRLISSKVGGLDTSEHRTIDSRELCWVLLVHLDTYRHCISILKTPRLVTLLSRLLMIEESLSVYLTLLSFCFLWIKSSADKKVSFLVKRTFGPTTLNSMAEIHNQTKNDERLAKHVGSQRVISENYRFLYTVSPFS